MKNHKIALTVGVASLALVVPAFAADVNFVPPTNFSWYDANMWTPPGVPVDGDLVDLEEGNIDFVIDVHNAASPGDGVSLPTSRIIIGRGSYIDSSAGGDPALADDGIEADIIEFNGAGGRSPLVYVPVSGDTFKSNRHGAEFYREITVREILAQSGHQDHWKVNVSPTGPIEYVLLNENRGADGGNIDGNFHFNADTTVTTLDHVWSKLVVGVDATLTVDTYNYTYYTNAATNNAINPVELNGDMTVATLNSIDIVTGTPVQEADGTYGAIGSGAGNEVAWITGAGRLTVGSGDYATWAEMFPTADLSDPDADHDGDGINNDDERLFGLDPTDAASVNPISVPLDNTAGTFSFTRRDDALTGKFSDVETSTDLVIWTVDSGAILAPGLPDGDNIETVAVQLSLGLLSAPKLFVRINQNDGILLSENFETDNGGFTFSTTAGSDWEWGAPDSSGPGGTVTAGNGSSANCWGTLLGDFTNVPAEPGQFAVPTTTVLRSTVIDLTEVDGATLAFAQASDFDTPGGDTAVVNVIGETSDTIVAGGAAIYTGDDSGETPAAAWNNVTGLDLTPFVGQKVRVEWRFAGIGTNFPDYMGWYIDDVTVQKTN